jgi:hypothetical protein
LLAREKALRSQLEGLGHDAGRTLLRNARADYQENPTAKNLAALRELETEPGKLDAHFARLRTEVKQALSAAHREAMPICAAVHRRLLAKLESVLGDALAAEAELSARFAIPTEPGSVSGGVENALFHLKENGPLEISALRWFAQYFDFQAQPPRGSRSSARTARVE